MSAPKRLLLSLVHRWSICWGRTLIPGFNDAPVHVASLGMLLTKYIDVRVHRAPNIPAVLALLTESRHLTREDLRWSSLLTSRTRYPPVAKFVM